MSRSLYKSRESLDDVVTRDKYTRKLRNAIAAENGSGDHTIDSTWEKRILVFQTDDSSAALWP